MNWYKLMIAVLFISCSRYGHNTTNMILDKQGHRGCRGLMPENTIPAMIKAIELGVNTLEMDVVITKDSQLILSHEPFFNHEITTKPNGSFVAEKEEKYLNIFKMNYAETSLFDVGLKPHPRFPLQEKIKVTKPLLSDLIDSTESFCRQKNISPVFYNIETKTQPATDNIYHPTPAVFINLLMAVIASRGIENRTIIQSFDIRTLQYLHLKFPNIQTALLIEGEDKRTVENQLKELGFNPTIYSPHFSLVTIDLIQKLHQQKIKIIPWTVDDAAQINRLKNLGVDGIITDDPGLF